MSAGAELRGAHDLGDLILASVQALLRGDLMTTPADLTPEVLNEDVEADTPDLIQTTTYRSLETLERLGVIVHIQPVHAHLARHSHRIASHRIASHRIASQGA